METKAIPLELDDLSLEKGTARIAHSVYDNIDLVNDVARKGMFSKSWKETKMADGAYDIDFYVNHNVDATPGKVIGVDENNDKAFTLIKVGSHTLGQDTIKQLDEGIIRRASFGFKTVRANIMKNGKNTRELKEVKHLETSVLTKLAANPKAGVAGVHKSFEGVQYDLKQLTDPEMQFVENMLGTYGDTLIRCATFATALPATSDLYTTAQYWVSRINDMLTDMKYQVRWNGPAMKAAGTEKNTELKEHLQKLHKFVRNSGASDSCLLEMTEEIKSIEQFLALNTADTQESTPAPSVSEVELKDLTSELSLLFFKHFD